MTRILSELLGVAEPRFRADIIRLERASGHASADIRLTAQMQRASKVKLQALGLNPHDTTGPELYQALQQRLKDDDKTLVVALKQASQQDDVVAAVAHALRTVPIPRSCFALKPVVAKRLLRKTLPKKTMKLLGYRSFDSMVKHEAVGLLYAAAWLTETETWRKSLLDQYKQLGPHDFDTRDITVLHPTSERWQRLTAQVVAEHRHTVMGIKELGAVILLPLPAEHPPVAITATLILALQTMNEIRASSTFLKLSQVRADFGKVVQTVVADEAQIHSDIIDQPISWQLVQRYYARFRDSFRAEIFEPHVQVEDLSWHSIERVLVHLHPGLAFWRGTGHLHLLHDFQPVSFNVIDVALSTCNQLPFAHRVVHYGRVSLWHELLLQYLKHDNIEQTVLGQLQSQLVLEPAVAN